MIEIYNQNAILKDFNGKPVPQYYNQIIQQFEVVEGVNGRLKVIMVDSLGNEIQSQDLVNQIANKIDELIGVVSE